MSGEHATCYSRCSLVLKRTGLVKSSTNKCCSMIRKREEKLQQNPVSITEMKFETIFRIPRKEKESKKNLELHFHSISLRLIVKSLISNSQYSFYTVRYKRSNDNPIP